MRPGTVCHVTSAHDCNDSRIFYRECLSLAQAGYEVDLVAQAEADCVRGKVRIHAIRSFRSRLARFVLGPLLVLGKAWKRQYGIVHFHDPELIFVGLLLKLAGKTVVFDVHENIVEQIRTKDYLPLRRLVAACYLGLDWIAVKAFPLVLAERSYLDIYSGRGGDLTVVMNFPSLSLLDAFHVPQRSGNGIFYIGGVSRSRGIDTMIDALQLLHRRGVDFTFHCVGDADPALMERIARSEQFREIADKVVFHGPLDIREGYEIARGCRIGVSILKPLQNYVRSYSTKIFEYMAVGLPVVTSNFPLYRDVVEASECGLCVDPEDPAEVADALEHILANPKAADRMGMNGRLAAERTYNWEHEEAKLLALYDRLTRRAYEPVTAKRRFAPRP
jgi:glycosyltransferase involved in cell wall biosynthesis